MNQSYLNIVQVTVGLSRKENSGVRLILSNLKNENQFFPTEGFVRNFVTTTDMDIPHFLSRSTACGNSKDSVFFKCESNPNGMCLKLVNYLECNYDREIIILELIKVLKQLGQDDTVRQRLESLHSFLNALPSSSTASYTYSKSDFILKVSAADVTTSVYMKGIDMNNLLFQFFFSVSKDEFKICIRTSPLETSRVRGMLGITGGVNAGTGVGTGAVMDVGGIIRPTALIINVNDKDHPGKSPVGGGGGGGKSSTRANPQSAVPVAISTEKQLILIQCLNELFITCNDCDIRAMCIIIDRLSNATTMGKIKLSRASMKTVYDSIQHKAAVKVPNTPNSLVEENNLLRKLHLCFMNSEYNEYKDSSDDVVWRFLTKGRGRILYRYDIGGKGSMTHENSSNGNTNTNAVDAGIGYSNAVWTLMKSCGITAGNWQSFLRDFDVFKQMWDLTSAQSQDDSLSKGSTGATRPTSVYLYATDSPGDPNVVRRDEHTAPNGSTPVNTLYKTLKLVEKHPFTSLAFDSVDEYTTQSCHVYTRRTAFVDSFIVRGGSSPMVREKNLVNITSNTDDCVTQKKVSIPISIDCDGTIDTLTPMSNSNVGGDNGGYSGPFTGKSGGVNSGSAWTDPVTAPVYSNSGASIFNDHHSSTQTAPLITPLAHSYASALTQTKPQQAASLRSITSTSQKSKETQSKAGEYSTALFDLVQQIRFFFESLSAEEVQAMGRVMDRLSNIPTNELCVDYILHSQPLSVSGVSDVRSPLHQDGIVPPLPPPVYKDEDSVKKLLFKLEPLGIYDLIEFITTGAGQILYAYSGVYDCDSESTNKLSRSTSASATITYSKFCKNVMNSLGGVTITPPQWQSFFRDYDIFKQAWSDTSTKKDKSVSSSSKTTSKGIVAIPSSDMGIFDCHSVVSVSQKLTKSKALAASSLLDKHPIGVLLFERIENEPFYYKRKSIALDSNQLQQSKPKPPENPPIRSPTPLDFLVQHVTSGTSSLYDSTLNSVSVQSSQGLSIAKLSRNTSEDNMRRVLPQHLLDDDDVPVNSLNAIPPVQMLKRESEASQHQYIPASAPTDTTSVTANGTFLSHNPPTSNSSNDTGSCVMHMNPDIEMTHQLLCTYLPILFSMPDYELSILCNLLNILESVDGQLILQEIDSFKETLFECLHLELGVDKSYKTLIDFVTSGRGHILFHYSKNNNTISYSALYVHCLESREHVTSNSWLKFLKNVDAFKQIYSKHYHIVTENATGIHTQVNIHLQYHNLLSHLSISSDLGLGLGLDLNNTKALNDSYYVVVKDNPSFIKAIIMLMNKYKTESLLMQSCHRNEALLNKCHQLTDERVELLRKIVQMEEQLKFYKSQIILNNTDMSI